MPKLNSREYRAVRKIDIRAGENEENSYIVEGYATTFNEPYEMYEWEGNKYYEQVDRHAFDNADLKDVILQYDHEGMVYARIKNGTLRLEIDEHGLKVIADLSSTEESRKLYEAISTGLVCNMSFAFTVEEDSYNRDERTRTIMKIRKVYDVSAVSIPANPGTDISARSYFDGVIEAERQEMSERERRIRILKLKAESEI